MNTQTQMILEHLKKHGSITPLQALDEYSCMRLGARIYDLRIAGWPIMKTIEEGQNKFGEKTHFAKYWMASTDQKTVGANVITG